MSSVQPPLIEIAVEPKTKGDQEPMARALARLMAEDPSFRVWVDHESRQTILQGVSEMQLETVVDRLRNEFKVEANVGAPQVAYRETISQPANADYTHKRLPGVPLQSAPAKMSLLPRGASFSFQSEAVHSGAAQYARVVVRLEPLPPGSGFVFTNDAGDAVPEEYLPAIEKAVRSSIENGALAGFPMIDFKVTLAGGAYHDTDSSALAFEIAARAAMKEGLAKAAPKLLEPIMKVEVVTPRDYVGDVIGDLNSRRAHIIGDDGSDAVLINATVPLANMFGYARDLTAMSQGRAAFTMQFSHYDRAPPPNDDGDDYFGPAVGMRA